MYQGCLEMERIRSKQRTKDAGWKGNGEKEENEEETYIKDKKSGRKRHGVVRSKLEEERQRPIGKKKTRLKKYERNRVRIK